MIICSKHNLKYLFLIFFFILYSCQFQEPIKSHGIIFLDNRAKQLTVKKSNKNDVIEIIGKPHVKSLNDDNTWIYLERVLTKGEYHKLGQNFLKKNNVLVLEFDKFGILQVKSLLDKDDLKKIRFSKAETENDITQKSFIQNVLQSIKQKMYSSR
jgi:outer membrane protein assembly factor BamE (lipoprotein component of BamABCDE complex)